MFVNSLHNIVLRSLVNPKTWSNHAVRDPFKVIFAVKLVI